MRVLHLNDRLSLRGGADLHLLGVLKELQGDFDQVLGFGRSDEDVSVDVPRRHIPGLDARDAQDCSLEPIFDELAPDLIHVHNVMNPVALRQAVERGAIMTVQDHRSFCPGKGKFTLEGAVCREPMSRELCRSCFTDDTYFDEIWALSSARLESVSAMQSLIVLSEYMRVELEQVGVDPGKIHVIPPFTHGLNLEAKPSGPPCVLFVGRLVGTKGVRDVVKAWEDSNSGLPLVVAGAGPERGQIHHPGIEWAGWVGNEELSGLYRRARVVVMAPRWQEPFGIVGLEARYFGVPVVAWESGGVAEWEPEVLVKWGDVDGLSIGIQKALSRDWQRSSSTIGKTVENMGELSRLYSSIMS